MLSVDLEGQQGNFQKGAASDFSYQSDLDSEHAAYLYSYVQKNKTKDPQLYAVYSERMERFVIDQLKAGRIQQASGLSVPGASFPEADGSAAFRGLSSSVGSIFCAEFLTRKGSTGSWYSAPA